GRPSSPDCTDRSHPHWSAGCSPTKSLVRYTPAGSCHGCDTAYPCRRRKGTSRANPSDYAHRLRHSSEAGRAGVSHPQSGSNPAILPCGRPWPRQTTPDHPRLRLRHQAVGTKVFLDIIDLRSGSGWEDALYEQIDTSDCFFLFWSSNAAQSSWVEREWRYALKRRGLDFINPLPLE